MFCFFSVLYSVSEHIYSQMLPACTPCTVTAVGVFEWCLCKEIGVVRTEALVTPQFKHMITKCLVERSE